MEAHENLLVGIAVALKLLAFDALFVHVLWHRVVDVEPENIIKATSSMTLSGEELGLMA